MAASEKKRQADRDYYRRNAASVRERTSAYNARQSAAWKAERRRVQVENGNKRQASTRYNEKLRMDVIRGYGGACACCGNDYVPHLTLDHVEGGGRTDRVSRGGRAAYAEARRDGFPPKYQLLCFNCNSAKHTQGGRCGCQDGA